MQQLIVWAMLVGLGTAALVAAVDFINPRQTEWQDLVASVEEARRDFK